jgi:hypothetical protein
MCPMPNGFRYLPRSIWNLARNIFLSSRRNAPQSETCESVWNVRWLLWLLLISPVILEDRMTRQNYLEFLQNELPEQLEALYLATRIAMYFQHDGATFHYTRLVMQHLNDIFRNRWIGRGSTIKWPPRSSDLTPLDFRLWVWMKSEVHRRKVDTYMGRTARSHNGCNCPHKGTSRWTQTSNTPWSHTSFKVLMVEFSKFYYKPTNLLLEQ